MAIKLIKSRISRLPERIITKSDLPDINFLAYFRFREFYGGWLIYELNDTKYRQYLSWTAACKIFRKDNPSVFARL